MGELIKLGNNDGFWIGDVDQFRRDVGDELAERILSGEATADEIEKVAADLGAPVLDLRHIES